MSWDSLEARLNVNFRVMLNTSDHRTGIRCLGTGADLISPAAGAGRTLLK